MAKTVQSQRAAKVGKPGETKKTQIKITSIRDGKKCSFGGKV